MSDILRLTDRFGVILVFPVTDTQPAHEKPEVLAVLGALGSICLGASTAEGLGFWQPTGEFERAIHCYTNFDGRAETLTALQEAVLRPVVEWAHRTNQQAVAFEIGAGLEIVETPDLEVVYA